MCLPTYKYHPYIDEYMGLVESGEIQTCVEQKQLIQFLRCKLDKPEIVIKPEMIEKSVDIPGKYFPYQLYPWQKFINAFIYGVYENDELMFSDFFIMMGRGGGKNGYISQNAFFMLTGHHGIPRYDIELVANAERQARISFEDVYNVLDDDCHKSVLGKAFKKTKELIQHTGTRSKLEFNSSNSKTKDGLRPGAIVFDEIHEFINYDNINVFTSALGKKPTPRIFYTTTNGYVRGGVLDDMLADAAKILGGEMPGSRLFPFICKLDREDEVDTPEMWEKANPSIRYNKTLFDTMKKAYDDMKKAPSLRQEFITKRMNLSTADSFRVVAEYCDILATDRPIPDNLARPDCIGGVDYAEMKDFCSVGLLFKFGGERYWIQHSFAVRKNVRIQNINPKIIDEAVAAGMLTLIDNPIITPELLVEWFAGMSARFYIKQINCDMYRERLLKEVFSASGLPPLNIVRRGVQTHSMLAPLVEDMFARRSIVFPGDCLMRWYCNNVYVHEHANGNKEYLKIEKEKRKTDGFFAFIHALVSDGEINEPAAFSPGTLKVYKY